MSSATPENPYGLCNFDPAADCSGCPINGRLFCHYKPRDTVRFLLLFLIGILPGMVGLVRRRQWRFIATWSAVFYFFLQVPENLILCSHCPYYAQGGRSTLLCHANPGLFKLWKFNPRPMAWWEKSAFLGSLAVLLGLPVAVNLRGGENMAAAGGVLGAGAWVWGMQRFVCSECPNFSCPLNRAPRDVAAFYLQHNPVFARAWGLPDKEQRS